jgi:hypothetical protein
MGSRPRRLGLETHPWSRLGLVIQGLGSRLGLGRLGLEPMSYFPLSRKEKHVTTRP